MQYTNYKLLPQRQLPPPFDAEGSINFVKKFVPALVTESHWLILADQKMAGRVNEIQQALGAQFEQCSVPNRSGVSMYYCPRSEINSDLFLCVLRGSFPDAAIYGDPALNWITCMAWGPTSPDDLRRFADLLFSIAEEERKCLGSGLRAAEQNFLDLAWRIDRARSSHLN